MLQRRQEPGGRDFELHACRMHAALNGLCICASFPASCPSWQAAKTRMSSLRWTLYGKHKDAERGPWERCSETARIPCSHVALYICCGFSSSFPPQNFKQTQDTDLTLNHSNTWLLPRKAPRLLSPFNEFFTENKCVCVCVLVAAYMLIHVWACGGMCIGRVYAHACVGVCGCVHWQGTRSCMCGRVGMCIYKEQRCMSGVFPYHSPPYAVSLILRLHLFANVYLGEGMSVPQHSMRIRRQLVGVSSLLSPCGCQGLNSGHQSWQQSLLPLSHLISPPPPPLFWRQHSDWMWALLFPNHQAVWQVNSQDLTVSAL